MDLINKLRTEPITSKEESCFANILGNKTIPKELIPALNINNYINPALSIGNGDDVGWTGYLQQNSLDYMLGGTVSTPSNAGALKPRFIFGNTPQAYSTKTISKAIITNAGSGYTTAPTVTITGDGSGAIGYAILSGGQISEIRISEGGQNYTNATMTISGGGGIGATATAYIASGQISSNLIYAEENSLLSKLSPNGTYIGTEFFTKAESQALVPNYGRFGSGQIILHNQTAIPNVNNQELCRKTFMISSSKVIKLDVNIQLFYIFYSSAVTANENTNITLTVQICPDPNFITNVAEENRDFTLKNSRFGTTADYLPDNKASYNLSFSTIMDGVMLTAAPKEFYVRVVAKIMSMTNPTLTRLSKQSTGQGDVLWTLIDPQSFGNY